MNVRKGFTLIELLVVVAIIGVLSTIVITNLSSPRAAASDAAIKSNLLSIRNQAELYYNTNDNYGAAFAATTCNNAVAGTMYVDDSVISNALGSAATAAGLSDNSGLYCAAVGSGDYGQAWAVAAPLRSSGWWCVDSTGFSGDVADPVGSGDGISAAGACVGI